MCVDFALVCYTWLFTILQNTRIYIVDGGYRGESLENSDNSSRETLSLQVKFCIWWYVCWTLELDERIVTWHWLFCGYYIEMWVGGACPSISRKLIKLLFDDALHNILSLIHLRAPDKLQSLSLAAMLCDSRTCAKTRTKIDSFCLYILCFFYLAYLFIDN